jgi:hypothetical protein
MLRAVLGLAVITTLCVLSPERDSKRHSGPSQARADAIPSSSLDFLSGLAATAALALPEVSDSAGSQEPQAAIVGAAARGAATAGIEGVRKIVIPPPPVPVDMPPLRR